MTFRFICGVSFICEAVLREYIFRGDKCVCVWNVVLFFNIVEAGFIIRFLFRDIGIVFVELNSELIK